MSGIIFFSLEPKNKNNRIIEALNTINRLAFVKDKSIPAILIKTPGTPANAISILDGYAMAQKGEPKRAFDKAIQLGKTLRFENKFGDGQADIYLANLIAKLPLSEESLSYTLNF